MLANIVPTVLETLKIGRLGSALPTERQMEIKRVRALIHIHGFPPVLAQLIDHYTQSHTLRLTQEYAEAFDKALPGEGHDLSRIGWSFMAGRLRRLPPARPGDEQLIEPIAAGLESLADGRPWSTIASDLAALEHAVDLEQRNPASVSDLLMAALFAARTASAEMEAEGSSFSRSYPSWFLHYAYKIEADHPAGKGARAYEQDRKHLLDLVAAAPPLPRPHFHSMEGQRTQ